MRWRASRPDSVVVSAGEPLPASVRRRAERSLGIPLSNVKLYRGHGGAQYADSFGARAVTQGDRIALGPDANDGTVVRNWNASG